MPPRPGYIDRRSGVNRTRLRTTVCAFGDGAFDVDTERADVGIGPYGVRSAGVRAHGRIYNPPLRTRFWSSRRGGLYGRPKPPLGDQGEVARSAGGD